MSDARASILEGLRAAVPELRSDFRDLLGPAPKGASWDLAHAFSAKKVGARYVTQGVSTCGLVAAGILRRAGFKLPWLGAAYWDFPAPYKGLDIVSCLTLLGQRTGARRPTGAPVQPGDIRCIGTGLATHVLTVVEVQPGRIISVDGGQVDDWQHGYLQRVKVCSRPEPGPRVVWTIARGRPSRSRHVCAVFSAHCQYVSSNEGFWHVAGS